MKTSRSFLYFSYPGGTPPVNYEYLISWDWKYPADGCVRQMDWATGDNIDRVTIQDNIDYVILWG